MSELRKFPVIAIDGGGTQCRLALDDGKSIVAAETGSANVSTDFEGALSEISAGLDSLAERAGLTPESLSRIPAFVGLAGMTGETISKRLRTALPFTHVRIEDDRAAALRGALGEADGAIAHCGTGSFFAAQSQGTMRSAGGWGPVLGDEASAHFVGKAALSMTLKSIDGQCPASPLAERILTDCEGCRRHRPPCGIGQSFGAWRVGAACDRICKARRRARRTNNARRGTGHFRDASSHWLEQWSADLPDWRHWPLLRSVPACRLAVLSDTAAR